MSLFFGHVKAQKFISFYAQRYVQNSALVFANRRCGRNCAGPKRERNFAVNH